MANGTDIPPPPHRFLEDKAQHVLTVDLPHLDSLDGVELDISGTQVRLVLPGHTASSSIALPADLQSAPTGEAVAKFSRKRRQLSIVWPVSQAEAPPAAAAAARPASAPTVTALPAPADPPPNADGGGARFSPPERVAAGAGRAAEPAGRAAQGASGGEAAEPPVAVTPPAAAPVPSPAPAPAPEAAPPPVVAGEPPHGSGSEPKAYGSIWNANSWHWEERKCLDLARRTINERLAQCQKEQLTHIRELCGASLVFKQTDVSGEAGISIRKGKRILCFELSLSFDWECRDEFGGPLGAKGTGTAKGITQDEDEPPEVKVQVSASSTGGKEAKAAGEWVRRQGCKAIAASLVGEALAADILAADERKLRPEEDRQRREAEQQRAEEARRSTAAAEQARIAQEQRVREAADRAAVQQSASQKAAEGSVWNTNGWHWEERNMNEWSRAWLVRELSALQVQIFGGGGSASLTDVQVSGDASVSIRKGKPIVLFLLKVECAWHATTLGLGEARGKLSIPEFASEDGARGCTIKTEVANTSVRDIAVSFRRDVMRPVRDLLQRFVDALGEQLPRKGGA